MNNRNGFTLVELMAVIAILAILLVGGGLAITSVINRQKSSVNDQQIKSIEDAAVTYIINKKYFVPVCKTASGTMITIDKNKVDLVNSTIEGNNTFKNKRNNFTNLNADTSLKEKLGGTSGIFGKVSDLNCFKLVSVKTLINDGYVDKADQCVTSSNIKNSVIVVYSLGDSADPNGAGQLVAVSSNNFCK